MHLFHTEFQHKFAWSSWQGSWQVLLFIYSLHVKLALGLCLVFRNFTYLQARWPLRLGLGVGDDLHLFILYLVVCTLTFYPYLAPLLPSPH